MTEVVFTYSENSANGDRTKIKKEKTIGLNLRFFRSDKILKVEAHLYLYPFCIAKTTQ